MLWSTHTGKSGQHNLLYLSNTGGLRLVTAGGKTVWSSRTTSALLGPGERLSPGQRITSVPGLGVTPFRIKRLTMQRNGDLVLTCGRLTGWRSHTSTPGSYAELQPNGRLVIKTRSGRTVWSTRKTTTNPQFVFSVLTTDTTTTNNRILWFMQTDDRCS